MVGHTGKIDAVVKALHEVDTSARKLVETVLGSGGRVLVTADHGNAEELLDGEGHPQTAHSCNPVPLVVVEGDLKPVALRDGGKLGDIAPTLLDLWEIEKPAVMTGESLVAGEIL